MQIRVLLVLLIIVAFVTNLITPYVFERYLQFSIPSNTYECLAAFFFGLKFSEYSLLGLALAYFPMPRFQRATLVLGLTTLFVISFMIGIRSWELPFQAALILVAGSWGGVALIGALAAVLNRVGLKIQHGAFPLSSKTQSHQFNVSFLLYVMVGVGLLASMLKNVLPKEAQSTMLADLSSICLWLLWLFISISMILLVTVFATLNQKPGRARIAFLLLMIFGPLLFHWVASIIFSGVPGGRLTFTVESFAIVYSVLAGILVGMGLVLFSLRRLGYRLNKIR
ncbi:MAG: hypothetical protein ACK5N9_19705 [Pirellula sp.]